MSKKPLLAVVGPTASGKTGLAIHLAEKFGGEIVSCDSMQIYKGMPIGTAQPTKEELERVPHHLIACKNPNEPYSVSDYVTEAAEIIEDIYSRGKLPVLCGGTGLYARSLIYGISFNENSRDDNLREKLTKRLEEEGEDKLFSELNALDPKAAESIDIKNHKRLIRALEYCLVTNKKFSEQCLNSVPRYDFLMLGINYRDREKLYERINLRVDLMMKDGLVDEAKKYYHIEGKGTSAQAIGYKELFPYFDGKLSLQEAAENIKLATRHYAKRQLTWFRKEQSISWIYPDDYSDKAEFLTAAEEKVKKANLF